MNDLTFVPLGKKVVCERQLAYFLTRMHELQKRFMDGSISPEFTLDGFQYLIEGNYLPNADMAIQTKIGKFKLFGHTIQVHDKSFTWGHGPKYFFEDEYASQAELMPKNENLIALFDIKDQSFMEPTSLAPYLFPQIKTSEMIKEIFKYDLYPKLTLGHIEILLSRYCGYDSIASYCDLYQGIDGNYFPLQDVNGKYWFLALWLHYDGRWVYRLHSVEEYSNTHFNQKNARLWLLPKSGYKEII